LMRILQTWGSEIISQLRKTSLQHHRKWPWLNYQLT